MTRRETKTDRVMSVLTGSGAGSPQPVNGAEAAEAMEAHRSLEEITMEIVALKAEAGKSIIGIGLRLIEAKAALQHGEWLAWLTDRVDFSEATAQRFMRLAREWSNPSALTDLGATKALKLLALPEPEREAFIAVPHVVDGQEKTVQEMSTRELEKAIRERDEAVQAKEAAENALAKAVKAKSEAEKAAEGAKQSYATAHKNEEFTIGVNKQLREEIEELKKKQAEAQTAADNEAIKAWKKEASDAKKNAEGIQKQLEAANAKNEELQKELTAAKATPPPNEKVTSEDRGTANYIMAKMGEDLNRLAGLLAKARQTGDNELAEIIVKNLTAWKNGMEALTK